MLTLYVAMYDVDFCMVAKMYIFLMQPLALIALNLNFHMSVRLHHM